MTPREVAEQLLETYSNDARYYASRSKEAKDKIQAARDDGMAFGAEAIVHDLRHLIDEGHFGE